MCFSAPVSFSAALILSLAGVATLKQARTTSQFPLASTPLLFSIQQFFEGILWLYLPDNQPLQGLGLFSAYIFLIYAMLFWPIWIPLSVYSLEKVKWRKNLLLSFLLGGICWTIFLLSLLPKTTVEIFIVEKSIQYIADVPINKLYYIFIILGSCFVSSFPKIWCFGLLVGISIVITEYFYAETFTSVWCFFSALMSLAIYWILKNQPPVDSGAQNLKTKSKN